MSKLLQNCTGFDWDEGNFDKNWLSHHVYHSECEELFFNLPIIVREDKKHSQSEQRHFALGRTNTNRFLFIAFTVRGTLIRVISARDMNERETKKYVAAIQRYSNL